MAGTVIMIVILVLGVPIAISVSALLASALFGWLLKSDVDAQHEGSELLELSERQH